MAMIEENPVLAKNGETTGKVRAYWEQHPLFSLEVNRLYGEEEFFDELEKIKKEDTECFTDEYWRFNQSKGKRVLDVGCGPGWYSLQYALYGANVTAMDLTRKAVETTSKYAFIKKHDNVRACQGDAQKMPFKDSCFDIVVSSGVLHHVPDPIAAFKEVRRVVKNTGEARVTLYYRNLLLRNRVAFKIMLVLLKISGARHHDVRSGVDPKTPDDFVRMYDGKNNPLGFAMTDSQWRELFHKAELHVSGAELHFFPLRFLPKGGLLSPLRRFLESRLGFLIYYRLQPK